MFTLKNATLAVSLCALIAWSAVAQTPTACSPPFQEVAELIQSSRRRMPEEAVMGEANLVTTEELQRLNKGFLSYFAYLEYPDGDFTKGADRRVCVDAIMLRMEQRKYNREERWMRFVEDRMGNACHKIAWATAKYLRGKTLTLRDESHYTVDQARMRKLSGMSPHIVTQVTDKDRPGEELWLDIQGVLYQNSGRRTTTISHGALRWQLDLACRNKSVLGVFGCPRMYQEETESASDSEGGYQIRLGRTIMESYLPLRLDESWNVASDRAYDADGRYEDSELLPYIQFWMSDKSNDFDCHYLTHKGLEPSLALRRLLETARKQKAFVEKFRKLQ